jgi:hypothetical protein
MWKCAQLALRPAPYEHFGIGEVSFHSKYLLAVCLSHTSPPWNVRPALFSAVLFVLCPDMELAYSVSPCGVSHISSLGACHCKRACRTNVRVGPPG